MHKNTTIILLAALLLITLSFGEDFSLKIRSAIFPRFFHKKSSYPLDLELENYLLYQEIDRISNRKEIPDALSAKVIYRPSSSFSSTLWIDVGELDNQKKGRVIVAKNSPVLSGKNVVGVVDYVGQKHSSVRLLTDPLVVPSVRCVRGNLELASLVEDLDQLLERVSIHPGMDTAFLHLREAKEILLEENTGSIFLAKGELVGASQGKFRKRGTTLLGTGFNYDFADTYGPARDLRNDSLLQMGDLLVTTGLDGVFPEGLRVAWVKEVKPLKEGDYYFDLVAEALCNFDHLEHLSVLVPLATGTLVN